MYKRQALGLVEAAKKIGFETRAIKAEMSLFEMEDVPYPFIAHVNNCLLYTSRRSKFKSRSEDGSRERKPNFKKSQKKASKNQIPSLKKQSNAKSDGQHFTIRKKGN